jgi:hypothetical protein
MITVSSQQLRQLISDPACSACQQRVLIALFHTILFLIGIKSLGTTYGHPK